MIFNTVKQHTSGESRPNIQEIETLLVALPRKNFALLYGCSLKLDHDFCWDFHVFLWLTNIF